LMVISFWGPCILQTKLTLSLASRSENWALVASSDPSFPGASAKAANENARTVTVAVGHEMRI